MLRNLIKVSKYIPMNGFNLSFCLLNGSLNFVPSSPRQAACCEPVSFSYRFRRRVNFFGTSISHRSTRTLYRPAFIFSHHLSISHSLLLILAILDRLFASLEARVRQFATPRYKNSHLRNAVDQRKRRNAHEARFLINARRARMPFHSHLVRILRRLVN